jgi:hypothetical protein
MDKIINKYDCKTKLKIDNSYFKFHPYYKKCLYNESDINIYNFGYKIIENKNSFNDFFNDVDYNNFLNDVEKINNLFQGGNLEFGGGQNGQVILSRLKKNIIINNKNIINNLYKKLLPSVEEKIYNSKIKVVDINAYKSCINNLKECYSSWLWHFDNHPNEMIKIMVYLTDVNEESSPMEIILDENDNPIKLVSDRLFKNDFKKETRQFFNNQYNGNRISDKDISELKNMGYKTKKIYGKKGTIILFSENIIHRATYPKTKERNVINTVISPTLKDQNYIDEYNTKINSVKFFWFEE